MYWDMVKILVDHINVGALPVYDQMLDNIVKKEVDLNLNEAKDIFEYEFVQKVEHYNDESEIDEFYHNASNAIMMNFKRQLDPYLNVGEEVSLIFDQFLEVYNRIKQENKRYNENLDYSESLDGSDILNENRSVSSNSLPKDDEEFNINMLDSTHNQPPPEETTPEKKILKHAPSRSQSKNDKIKELADQLKYREEEIKALKSKHNDKIVELTEQLN